MPDHDRKRSLLAEIAAVGKALAQPTRLELLELLAQGERSVGTRIYYRLAGDVVAALLGDLRSVASTHAAAVAAAARSYLGHDVELIGRDELRRRARSGDLVIIDVRPTVEFDAGHIAGAISMPLDELDRRLNELPDGVEIVAYCRGPYCVFAHEAVRRLGRHGRRARRLVDGFPEWRNAGLPVATGAASS